MRGAEPCAQHAAWEDRSSPGSHRSASCQGTTRQAAQPIEVPQVRGYEGVSPLALCGTVARAADLSPTHFARTPPCRDRVESRGGTFGAPGGLLFAAPYATT